MKPIVLLARMARFVIADISDAKSVLQELQAIVPSSPKLPVQPIILAGPGGAGHVRRLRGVPLVLKVLAQQSGAAALHLKDQVIEPVEAQVAKLRA